MDHSCLWLHITTERCLLLPLTPRSLRYDVYLSQQRYESLFPHIIRHLTSPSKENKLLFLVLATFSYTRHALAIFTRPDSTRKRKVSDLIGFLLFAANVVLNVKVLLPLEKKVRLYDHFRCHLFIFFFHFHHPFFSSTWIAF